MLTKELKVKPIENGTVIDHIPAGMAFKVISIIASGRDIDRPMSIVMNVESKRLGKKDIVKMEDLVLKKREVDKIGLIAPEACINIIENASVAKKREVDLPKRVVGIVKCSNPNCVSNQNEPVDSEFVLASKTPIRLRCIYCERDVTNITENLI
ncbi:MAG: aspartate carbamoyltransferase regulatory subunit [Thermoplasmata archaeon]|nr:aspartate carbamoyltransferase regulatory subunit [Thermoplasmata archaeon]